MNNGSDIRCIYELYTTNPSSSINESTSNMPGHIPELGVKVVHNDRGENDGDRYYETWEVYNISDREASGPPIDWDYVDTAKNETIEDAMSRVRSNYERTGRPVL